MAPGKVWLDCALFWLVSSFLVCLRLRLQSAESWCSLALGLSKFCGHNWTSAADMKASYGQLLASLASVSADSELR